MEGRGRISDGAFLDTGRYPGLPGPFPLPGPGDGLLLGFGEVGPGPGVGGREVVVVGFWFGTVGAGDGVGEGTLSTGFSSPM